MNETVAPFSGVPLEVIQKRNRFWRGGILLGVLLTFGGPFTSLAIVLFSTKNAFAKLATGGSDVADLSNSISAVLMTTSFGFLTALLGLPLLIVSIVLFSVNRNAMKPGPV